MSSHKAPETSAATAERAAIPVANSERGEARVAERLRR